MMHYVKATSILMDAFSSLAGAAVKDVEERPGVDYVSH